MSLAMILFPPPTDAGMEEWFFAHLKHHEAIIGAVKASRGVELTLYQIYPVNAQKMDVWLLEHQSQHNDMNRELSIPGDDLSTVNFQDKEARSAWFYSHFIQHQAAGLLCGQPI